MKTLDWGAAGLRLIKRNSLLITVEQKKKFFMSGFQDILESVKGDQCCDWFGKRFLVLFEDHTCCFSKNNDHRVKALLWDMLSVQSHEITVFQKSGKDCRQNDLRPNQFGCPYACLPLSLFISPTTTPSALLYIVNAFQGSFLISPTIFTRYDTNGSLHFPGHCLRPLSRFPSEWPFPSAIDSWHPMIPGGCGRLLALCFCQDP